MHVAVVGSGFAGIGMGVALQRAGVASFTIYDRGDRVGGVWRDNSYPGLTCDVPSHLYSFSFEPKHDWSRRFPPRADVPPYREHCADKYGLREHTRFNTEVAAADFDQDRGVWLIALA